MSFVRLEREFGSKKTVDILEPKKGWPSWVFPVWSHFPRQYLLVPTGNGAILASRGNECEAFDAKVISGTKEGATVLDDHVSCSRLGFRESYSITVYQ